MHMHRPCSLLAALLLTNLAGLEAQNTWIVAQSGGGHFTNVAPAVAAAQDGDLILVQPGYYNVIASGGIVTNKALRILGGAGRTLSGGLQPIVDVQGLAAGKTFIFDGFALTRVGSGGTYGPVYLQGNAGMVHLANLSISETGMGHSVEVNNCAHVTMTRCSTNIEVQCYTSSLTLNGCDFRGTPALQSSPAYGTPASPGMMALFSQVRITDCTILGGNGHLTMPAVTGLGIGGGNTVIARGPGRTIGAGTAGTQQPVNCPAIDLINGTLEIDAAMALVPHAGAPAIALSGTATSSFTNPVFLTSTGGSLGASVQFAIGSLPGELIGLWGGNVATYATATPYGTAWVDPAQALALAVAVQWPSGMYPTSIPVPNVPTLRGLLFGFHAVAGGTTEPVRLSALSPIVLR